MLEIILIETGYDGVASLTTIKHSVDCSGSGPDGRALQAMPRHAIIGAWGDYAITFERLPEIILGRRRERKQNGFGSPEHTKRGRTIFMRWKSRRPCRTSSSR